MNILSRIALMGIAAGMVVGLFLYVMNQNTTLARARAALEASRDQVIALDLRLTKSFEDCKLQMESISRLENDRAIARESVAPFLEQINRIAPTPLLEPVTDAKKSSSTVDRLNSINSDLNRLLEDSGK